MLNFHTYLCLILAFMLAPGTGDQVQGKNEGRIAFYSTRDGHHEIYVVNPDGSNLKRLTFGDADNLCPAFSPDGKRIAFLSKRDGNNEIYVMNADGSNQVRLTNTPFPEHHQSWSPDGTKIIFKAHRPENRDIYVMDADGSNVKRLTNHPALDAAPDWSPDGERIAFCSERDGEWEIYIMQADGGNQRRLTHNSVRDVMPAWSPDSKQILFYSKRNDDKDIYVMDADGSNERRLTVQKGVDEDGCWSPDGKHIVFQSNREGNYEIYVMDADGGNQRRLTNHPAGEYWPSWGLAVGEDQLSGIVEFPSYKEMRERVGELYSEKRYKEAVEILETHLTKFPEKLEANTFNLAFFYALLEQHTECFEILDYALDRGVWFSTFFLENETFAKIKDTEHFIKIRARNDSLRQIAQAVSKSDFIINVPEEYTSESKYPLFIALHGGDGNMTEFKEVWSSALMKSEFVVAYVQSSQLISMNGFSWENSHIARRDINEAYQKIKEKCSIDTEQVIIGGFSSGGVASLDITLSNTFPLAGFVVLCPGKPEDSFTKKNVRKAKKRGIRGTIITTEMEPEERFNNQKEMIEYFKDEGLQYQYMVTPDVGHIIPDDIGIRIDRAINHIRNR